MSQPLPTSIQDREYQKFDRNAEGEVVVRTTSEGTFSQSGLSIGGRHSIVTINDSAWTLLPASALENRNAISIQNFSGAEIKVNYQDDVDYVGMRIPNGNERYYDIKESILIYGRAALGSGSVDLDVEELA